MFGVREGRSRRLAVPYPPLRRRVRAGRYRSMFRTEVSTARCTVPPHRSRVRAVRYRSLFRTEVSTARRTQPDAPPPREGRSLPLAVPYRGLDGSLTVPAARPPREGRSLPLAVPYRRTSQGKFQIRTPPVASEIDSLLHCAPS